MDSQNTLQDWSLLQAFLAVAEAGSLSGAALASGQSQPTLGRHIKALETALEAELFLRHPKGLSLTELGREIETQARAMRERAARIELLAEQSAGTLEGTVRIACSVFAAHHILPPVIATLREVEPRIALVLRPSDDSDNLTFREADLAVRMYRPHQLDLITKQIADVEMGSFAAHSYIQRRGRPGGVQDLWTHDVVGFDQSTLMLDVMADLGVQLTPEDFAVRTDNQTAYWELVRAGCGIGFTQAHLGRADPLVEELHLGIPIPPLPIWLTTHESARRVPRIDRIWTLLDQHIPTVLA